MSKELDKFKKEAAPLSKAVDKLNTDYTRHTTNREHHKQMLLEGAKEIGRAAQICKDRGVAGNALKDFIKEPEILTAMKGAQSAMAALAKEESVLKKILSDTDGTLAKLDKLIATMDKEVSSRTKKKDRKLLAVDSKSLPDMEKLLAEIRKDRTKLFDEVKTDINLLKWEAKKERANFDKWVATEIGRTKADSKKVNQKETDSRAFDIRLVKGALGKMKTHLDSARSELAQAEKHFKNKQLNEADACIGKAMDSHAEMKKIQAPYVRELKSLNKWNLESMKQSKDGKFVLSAIENMATAIDGLSKLIKKTSRASI